MGDAEHDPVQAQCTWLFLLILLSASPLPQLLRALQRGCTARSAWARRIFHQQAGAAASSPRTELPPDPEGFWGPCVAHQPCQPLPHPCSGTAKDELQDAPQGSAPPLPGGHLRPGSSPSSAFPGGFRLPLFLPGARTFVPARPRPGGPALTGERTGASAGMKHRGLPRHPRRAQGTGPGPSSLPAHLRRPFSAQIRHQFSFWIISSSKKSSPKNIKHRPAHRRGNRDPASAPAPQPGKLQPRSRSGPLFLVRLNSLLPCGSFRNIYRHWGEQRGSRRGAPNPPAPLRPAERRARRRAGGQGGGGAVPVPPEPRDPPAASRTATHRAPTPPRNRSRKRERPREPGGSRVGWGGRRSPPAPPVAPGGGPELRTSPGRCRTPGGIAEPRYLPRTWPQPSPAPPEPLRSRPRRERRHGALTDRQAQHVERHEDLPALHPAAAAAPRPGPAPHMARNGAGPAGR